MGKIGDWYHNSRIRKLQDRYDGVVSGELIRRHYFSCDANSWNFSQAIIDGRIELDYGVDVLCTVGESLPRRAGRFCLAVLDTLLPL